MKKLNKKGFTLIELLAVIVILAILVTVSVPAITKYLGTARKGTFVTNAQTAISAVRNDVIINGYINKEYTLAQVNELFESGKTLKKSPYGKDYDTSSYVIVAYDEDTKVTTYSICLVDSNGAGIELTAENNLTDEIVKTSSATCGGACSAPSPVTSTWCTAIKGTWSDSTCTGGTIPTTFTACADAGGTWK